MENSRQYGRRGVNMGNIIGDPFALATISISAVSKKTHLDPRKHLSHLLWLRHRCPLFVHFPFRPHPGVINRIDKNSADITLAGMGDIFHLFYYCSDPDWL